MLQNPIANLILNLFCSLLHPQWSALHRLFSNATTPKPIERNSLLDLLFSKHSRAILSAHLLAKQGIFLGSDKIWFDCLPDCIREIVASESQFVYGYVELYALICFHDIYEISIFLKKKKKKKKKSHVAFYGK